MMNRIRKKEFSHLLVLKIDCISRNLKDFTTMYEELKDMKVTFISKAEQFDTFTAIGEAMLKIILVFAELERMLVAERVYGYYAFSCRKRIVERCHCPLWICLFRGNRVPCRLRKRSRKSPVHL